MAALVVDGVVVDGASASPIQNNYNNSTIRQADSVDVVIDGENGQIRQWKDSIFAVGYTNSTWKDEKINTCCDLLTNFTPIAVSGYFCKFAKRVGNMIILIQKDEKYSDNDNNRRDILETNNSRTRPKLICVVGPYWMVMICLTIPLFIGVSLFTALTKVHKQDIIIIISWSICTCMLFVSLLCVSCTNPGILYRHTEPLNDNWIWNDQALTYRPPTAKYDSECAVVIEQFDHTCPWTGTAIGKNNMPYFRLFLFFIFTCLAYDVILLVLL